MKLYYEVKMKVVVVCDDDEFIPTLEEQLVERLENPNNIEDGIVLVTDVDLNLTDSK